MNEAMKQAWLEITQMLGEPTKEELDVFLRTWTHAIKAERDKCKALAAPVQEPVAWNEADELQCPICKITGRPYPKCGCITYTTPPAGQRTWVGLTDEEIKQMGLDNYRQVVREVEAKLKEKNT
jgi:hypothetical protein